MEDPDIKKANSLFEFSSENGIDQLAHYFDKAAPIIKACGSNVALAYAVLKCGPNVSLREKKAPAKKKKKEK